MSILLVASDQERVPFSSSIGVHDWEVERLIGGMILVDVLKVTRYIMSSDPDHDVQKPVSRNYEIYLFKRAMLTVPVFFSLQIQCNLDEKDQKTQKEPKPCTFYRKNERARSRVKGSCNRRESNSKGQSSYSPGQLSEPG